MAILDVWKLFFRDLIYPETSGITEEEFVEQLNEILGSQSASSDIYQQNPDVIRYIPLLAEDIAGKAYSSIKKCADRASINASPERHKVVEISTTRSADGVKKYAKMFEGGDMYDYVDYICSSQECHLIFDYIGSASKISRIKNATVTIGADYGGAIGKVKFDSCKLLIYRDAIFEDDSEINDCVILVADGKTVSMEGGSKKNVISNVEITVDSETKEYGTSDYNYVETMPDDASEYTEEEEEED